MVGFGYGWKNYRDLDGGLQRFTLPHLNLPRQQPSGTTESRQAPNVNGQDQNILIAGADDRSDMTPAEIRLLHVGRDASLSTDVIMVVHVPADGSEATLLSIPRDSYVDIPGFRKNKINAAYADGYTYTEGSKKAKQAAGFDKLIQTVTDLTGLRITHYVQVGFIGFYRIAQAINGVTVDLCRSVSDRRYSGFVQSAGVHHLTPVQSLQFVRQRHNIVGGDLGRAKRQRYFITAAFRKIASAHVLLNPNRLGNLVRALTRSFYVDSTFKVTDFALQMSDLSANNIVGRTIPTKGAGSTDAGDVILVDPVAVRKFAANLVYKSTPSPKPTTSAPSRPAGQAHTTAPATQPIDAGCVN
jgi:LCP family protein required for cell wall assembly